MMKNKIQRFYVAILCVITAICICVGTINHFEKSENNHNEISNDSVFDEDSENWTGNFINPNANDFYTNLEKFTKIRISAAILEVKIVSGNDYSMEFHTNSAKFAPEFSVENETLTIRQITQKKKKKNFFDGKKVELKITIPKNTELEKIDITVNVGDFEIKNIISGSVKIKTNVGEIDIENIQTNEIDIQGNVGDINIEDVHNLDDFSIYLTTNVGNIKVKNQNYKKNFEKNTKSNKIINIKTNIGEIELS